MPLASEILCSTLQSLGVDCVFGLPGTQNTELFDGLRRARLRTVLATHELAAAFMANGYARASGRVGVIATIPGPGFTYALTGLAEARLDSVPLLHIVGPPARHPGRRYQLQALDQATLAGPLVKRRFVVDTPRDLARVAAEAYRAAQEGEPGPVVLEVGDEVLGADAPSDPSPIPPTPDQLPDPAGLAELARLFAAARRPALLVGQGAAGAADRLGALAEARQIPVLTTPSGRGILPEDHPLCMGFDVLRGGVEEVNALMEAADLILALGCKLSHNGSAGFQLRLPPDRLVQVDASAEVLGANYPGRLLLHARVAPVIEACLATTRSDSAPAEAGWSPAEIAGYRDRIRRWNAGHPEPSIAGAQPSTPAAFFDSLRRVLPRDGILVTDSGLHQVLARRHFPVLAPRGLIVPSDFQSMGFGLPAAIGARLAAPDRPVVALLGDGGFQMSGMELLTAAREGLPLVVVVFNDGLLNQIRLQQVGNFGHTHAVRLNNPDFAGLAAAFDVRYLAWHSGAEEELRAAFTAAGPTLMEVGVGGSGAIAALQANRMAREAARSLLGRGLVSRLKSYLRR
jgi:acetolactate synthase-1/2/3 large subunit